MTVTEQQARALTFLAMACRPTGAPRWDEAGVFANIMKVADRGIGTVTIAVVQAAEDRTAATPGVIPKPGKHWRTPEAAPVEERHPKYDPRLVCHICNLSRNRCLELNRDDHEFISVEANRAGRGVAVPDSVRDAITETRTRPRRDPDAFQTLAAPAAEADNARTEAAHKEENA